MLLILSIIVSIKRAYIVIGNIYIELSMIYAVRFERLFLEPLSLNNHQYSNVKKIKIYKHFEQLCDI